MNEYPLTEAGFALEMTSVDGSRVARTVTAEMIGKYVSDLRHLQLL